MRGSTELSPASGRDAEGARPILEMKGIAKRYPGVVALANVDFALMPVEVHGLVGENGAGKSTLIKILSGAIEADAGEIRVEGEPVARPTPTLMHALGVAVIYQELMLAPHLSAAENLFLGRLPRTRLGTIDWREAERRSEEIMARLGFRVARGRGSATSASRSGRWSRSLRRYHGTPGSWCSTSRRRCSAAANSTGYSRSSPGSRPKA